MSRGHVVVLFNAPSLPRDDPRHRSEADVAEVASEVASVLDRAGFEVRAIAAEPPLSSLVHELESPRPDLVFNLIEGFAGSSAGESWITGLLDLLRLPYTGCPPEAQSLCHAKGRTKALLKGTGLPTAQFLVVSAQDEAVPEFDGPYFVKPDAEDASLGIDQGSVAIDRVGLASRVAQIRREYGGDVLVEAYLPGREFNVGILALPEPRALSIAEVIYATRPNAWPILTYEAKWDIGSAEDFASPVRCPADIAPDLAKQLRTLAIAAFCATGCRDYARVDFRLDAAGHPMILEVNPNPDLGPSAGWARALRLSGRSYEETLVSLATQAMARGPRHG